MSDPIVFISHNAVQEGKLGAFRDAFAGVAKALDAEKPGTVVYLAFAQEDGSEVSVVHVFPDADARDQHLRGVQERMATVAFIQSKGYEIYGTPSEPVLGAMRGFAAAEGVPLRMQRDHLGGYLRPGSNAPS